MPVTESASPIVPASSPYSSRRNARSASLVAGVIRSLVAAEGDELKVGEVLAVIDTD